VRGGGRDESSEGEFRRRAELGRLLAAAKGYRVVTQAGEHVGWLDRIRYERHADHPDEIVVRGRALLRRRRRVLPFDAVEEVRTREKTIVLRSTPGASERSPSA
jgi:PRC-barrel domain